MADQMGTPPETATAPDRAEPLAPGSTIGNYRIEGIAGVGGMGVVYRATQQRPNRTVALKVIRTQYAADPEFRARFEREADDAAKIQSPRVIPIFEAGEQGGVLYLAMAYIDGVDLRRWLAEHGSMPPQRALNVVSQIAEALDAAHEKGLIHRDVKPGNVLLLEWKGQDQIYLTDFGLTKRQESAVGPTKAGTWLGTVDYSPPEQIRGLPIDARADIYALGVLLFELLSGQVPFVRDSEVSRMFAHVNDPPPSLAQFSSGLARFDPVIQRAMAKDPNARFPSAGDLARAAVAANEMRNVSIGERSVATGDAAPLGAETLLDRTPATQLPPPPLPPPHLGPQLPPQRPAHRPPELRRRRWWKRPAIVGPLGLVVAAAIAAVVVLALPHTSDMQLVENAVNGYFETAGPGVCNYLTSQAISNSYGDPATCRQQNQRTTAQPVTGTQMVQITGMDATVSGFTAGGHPMMVTLVKQSDGTWAIQSIDNIDKDGVVRTVTNWDQAFGGATCNYLSPVFLANDFNNSLSKCQSENTNTNPAPIASQSVQFTSATEATDDIRFKDGTKAVWTLSKQPNGRWLIDSQQQ